MQETNIRILALRLIPPSPTRTLAWHVETNLMIFPAAVPEIPVSSMGRAVRYYVDILGFTCDWEDVQGGIAGISKGNCRLFLTDQFFRESLRIFGPVAFWLNLESKVEVDEFFARWKASQATIVSEPADKPWKLREFLVADLDGNQIRVFYDFRSDEEGNTI